MAKSNLNETLRGIVLKYGIERVDRALNQFRKSSLDSADRPRPVHKQNRSQTKEPPTGARVYVSKLEVSAEQKLLLEQLAVKFEKKAFLPTVGDIRNFCAIYGIDLPRSSSRVSAIPTIFRHLSRLAPEEARSILQANSFSGPSQLAPIADAIRRSSEDRTNSELEIRRLAGSSTGTPDVKEGAPSKPSVPSEI